MLIDYTTYDDVRSALGVSSDELEDATLELETWDNHLQFELEEISAVLPTTYAAIVSTPEGARTAAEKKVYRAIRLYATLAVANSLTAALPMFGPKDISDGKATVSRFADSPYRSVVSKIKEQFETARDRLKSALGELNSSSAVSTPRAYMGVATLGTDPVTGE